MRKFILLVAFGFISTGVFAQSPLEEGGVQLNLGVGATDWGFVPVYLGLDYGIARDFTLGGQISFITNDDAYYYGNTNYNNNSAIGIGVNGNYHFNRVMDIPSKFDFYAGSNLTAYIWNYDNNDYHPGYDSVGFGLQVGGRYFFTNKFGINLEFGAGTATSGAKFGVTFKL
jgi:outer membrane immunogenic protein